MQNLNVNTCYEESMPYTSKVWSSKIFYELAYFYKVVIWVPYVRDQIMIIIVLITLKL